MLEPITIRIVLRKHNNAKNQFRQNDNTGKIPDTLVASEEQDNQQRSP
jgi:hypothetical protein